MSLGMACMWTSQDSLSQRLGFSLHPLSPGDGLDWERLYLLSHLSYPAFRFLNETNRLTALVRTTIKEYFCRLEFCYKVNSTESTLKGALAGSTKRQAWGSVFSLGCGSSFDRSWALPWAPFLPPLSQHECLNTASPFLPLFPPHP